MGGILLNLSMKELKPGLPDAGLKQHQGTVILARHLNTAKLILFISINTKYNKRILFFNVIKVTNKLSLPNK